MKRAVRWLMVANLIIAMSVTSCDYTNPGNPNTTRVPQEIVTARSVGQPTRKDGEVGPK